MKKFFYLNITLIIFCTINFCCAEDFFIEKPNAKTTEAQASNSIETKVKNISENAAKTTGNALKKIKQKNKKKNKKQKDTDEMPKGYYGTLPNVYSEFKYKKKTPSTPKDDSYKIPSLDELNEEELKSAPFDDTLFLDNIIKKEKTSDYVNNIQRVKFALNRLKESLEAEIDIQKINASINMVNLYATNLEKKYENKSESLKESYKEVITTNYYAKLFGNLIYESQYYSQLIPTQSGQYSKENINSKRQELLNKTNKTLFLLNQES